MKIKTKSCSIALALSLFILFLISSTVSTASAAPENLTVYFIDVGQGDSILLEYGDNEMLIDAGEIGKGDDVENYVKSKGVTSLDYVVATHPHSDHIGGMPVILQDFPVSHFLDSGYPQTTEIYETMLSTIDSKNIPFATLKRGDKIDFASGIDVEVLNPGSTYFKDDLNQNSIVLKVTDEKVSFLLTGDAGIEAENAIMSAGYDVNANILKVGHHGNNTASGASFISAVSPEVSVIEVGAGNQYGHPHAETLNTLQNAGTAVYRTDYNGSVTITTDGLTYTVTKEKPAGSNQQVPVFPVADFNVNTTSGYAPLDVQFTDVSQNAISRSWYFGDGITSTDQNPKHTYSAAGTYTANLTVRNANGTNSKTSEITVSNLNMPTTIKVLRTATGQIETVDFDYYVKNVMPNEWGMPGWPTETLKAGAMAVKMYGWDHVAAYHKYPGLGYDVKDTTADQVYIPGSEQLYTNAAVNATWNYTMTRNGQLFEPEYDSGVVGSLKPIYPNRLSQQGAVILANQGKTWDQILHYYYDPRGAISIQNIDFGSISLIPVLTIPIANFKSNVTNGYAPLDVQFTDVSQNAISRNWDFGDGITSTDQNPMHTYSVAGTYTANLTANNENGTNSKTVTITVTDQSSSSDSSSSGSSHSSSGGSSGGGAGGSPEPAKNVEAKEISQAFVTNGKPVKFDFPREATCIVYVSFDSKRTTGKTTTIAEQLKNKSNLISDLNAGEVYKYFNVWVGTGGFATSKNIENPVVCFKVDKSWLQDKNIDQNSITLSMYSDKKWSQLPTKLLKEDNKYLYFMAETPEFSFFAITGKTIEQEKVTETKPATGKGKATSTPGFETVCGIVFLITVFLHKSK